MTGKGSLLDEVITTTSLGSKVFELDLSEWTNEARSEGREGRHWSVFIEDDMFSMAPFVLCTSPGSSALESFRSLP